MVNWFPNKSNKLKAFAIFLFYLQMLLVCNNQKTEEISCLTML